MRARRKNRVGRNDPCPCGSGRKYKKCCLIAKEAWRLKPIIERNLQIKQKERSDKYGWVRPIIHEKFHGKRFIAIGSRLHFSEKWETMTDFLTDYLKLSMGKKWWLTEVKKSQSTRHPVVRWAFQMYEHQKKHGIEEDNGLISVEPNGPTMAYLTLAYDLYVLQDNQAFQKNIIKRIKRQEHFEGARYELYVAATMVRAGFKINYEDERDGTTKHPEFIAQHKESGAMVAVEAKKRHRDKVHLKTHNEEKIRLGIKRLLKNAFEKFDEITPYVIFVDISIPPIEGNPFEKKWFEELKTSVDVKGARDKNGLDRFNLIVFTNYPVDYTVDSAPLHNYICVVPMRPKVQIPQIILDSIIKSVEQFGRVPSFFEE